MIINQKTLSIFWFITGAAALLLLVLTVILGVKTRELSNSGFMAFITGEGQPVYIRYQPSEKSRIVTILEHGSSVFVTDRTTRNEIQWYRVQAEEVTGWVLSVNISLSPP